MLDEIHEYPRWRNLVKGLYDKRWDELKILVTGSARLDLYRRGGDSLQGRYHYFSLHPLSVAELKIRSTKDFKELLQLGGFPEPFFGGSLREKKRWSMEYRTRPVREDVRDLERVSELMLLERLMMRFPAIVRWCDILEHLYFIFRVPLFGSPRLRAIKKGE